MLYHISVIIAKLCHKVSEMCVYPPLAELHVLQVKNKWMCVQGLFCKPSHMCVLPRVSERLILIIGLLVIICGFIIWMPYGPDHPDIEMSGEDF